MLKTDSRPRGGGHRPSSCHACTDHHMDGCNFAFRLDKYPALHLSEPFRHIFRDFILWGDWVSEIEAASCTNRCFCDNMISPHQYFMHDRPQSRFPDRQWRIAHIPCIFSFLFSDAFQYNGLDSNLFDSSGQKLRSGGEGRQKYKIYSLCITPNRFR